MRLAMTAIAVLLSTVTVAAAETCLDCHRDPAFEQTQPRLFNYFAQFETSVHGVAGLGCVDCHGGDTQSTDLETIHAGVLEPVKFDRITDTCGRCHGSQREAFVTSDHYRSLQGDAVAPNCASCHGAMEMDFIFVTRVKSTCVLCHNVESNVSPEVPSRAEYVLNTINVIKGYRGFVAAQAKDRELVAELNRRYDGLTARWHRFDLADIEDEAQALLGDYRRAKSAALEARDEED